MSKKNLKIIYDKKNAVLSVEIGKEQSVDSDIQDNAVIDYDKSGNIVRINLYEFSFSAFKENRRVLRNFTRQLQAPFVMR